MKPKNPSQYKKHAMKDLKFKEEYNKLGVERVKIKEGDWIRTLYNNIEKVYRLHEWFGAVDISYDPRLLLKTGDLVMLHGFIIEVYLEEETKDLYSYWGHQPILRNNITKIWTKDVCNDYILQWEE